MGVGAGMRRWNAGDALASSSSLTARLGFLRRLPPVGLAADQENADDAMPADDDDDDAGDVCLLALGVNRSATEALVGMTPPEPAVTELCTDRGLHDGSDVRSADGDGDGRARELGVDGMDGGFGDMVLRGVELGRRGDGSFPESAPAAGVALSASLSGFKAGRRRLGDVAGGDEGDAELAVGTARAALVLGFGGVVLERVATGTPSAPAAPAPPPSAPAPPPPLLASPASPPTGRRVAQQAASGCVSSPLADATSSRRLGASSRRARRGRVCCPSTDADGAALAPARGFAAPTTSGVFVGALAAHSADTDPAPAGGAAIRAASAAATAAGAARGFRPADATRRRPAFPGAVPPRSFTPDTSPARCAARTAVLLAGRARRATSPRRVDIRSDACTAKGSTG